MSIEGMMAASEMSPEELAAAYDETTTPLAKRVVELLRDRHFTDCLCREEASELSKEGVYYAVSQMAGRINQVGCLRTYLEVFSAPNEVLGEWKKLLPVILHVALVAAQEGTPATREFVENTVERCNESVRFYQMRRAQNADNQ